MIRKYALSLGAAVLAAATVAWAQGQGILFPDWSKPTKGTYEAPAHTIGKSRRLTSPGASPR